MSKSRKKITSLVVAVMYALCILVAAPVQAYAYTPDTHAVAKYSKAKKAAQTTKALKALAKLPKSTTSAKAYDNAYEYTLLVSRYNDAANQVLRAKNMGVSYKGLKNYARLAISKARINVLRAVVKTITPVIALINALPDVITFADTAKVNAANDAFNALSAAEQKLVPNVGDLTEAVAELAALNISTVTSVSAVADITTQLGKAVVLPTTVTVTLSAGTTDLANVTWATTPDVSVLGTTAIAGTLSVPVGKTWTLTTAQKAVTVNVIVIPVLTAQLAKITNSVVTTVPYATGTTPEAVDAAMLVLANVELDAGFTASIVDSTYNTTGKIWTGKFVVTNTATNAKLTDSSVRILTIVYAPSNEGALDELAFITDAVVITVPYGTANTQVAVEAAMLKLANTEIASGYTATILAGSTYSTVSKIWTGKFKVTNNLVSANTATDVATRNFTVFTAVDTTAAAAQLTKVTNTVVGTVPFGTVDSQATVEAAMVALATKELDTGFTAYIVAGSTYSTVSKLWTGKFGVTQTATTATVTDAAYRSFTVITGVNTTGAAAELVGIDIGEKVLGEFADNIVPAGTANTQAAVEAALLTLANDEIASTYTATIVAGSTYSTVTKYWTGKFKVTNNLVPANTATDADYRIFPVEFAVAPAAAAELAKITNAKLGTVPYGTDNTQAGVELAIDALATAAIGPNYNVTIESGSTYSTVTKLWTGKLTVTHNSVLTNTITDADYRNITIAVAADTSSAKAELDKVLAEAVKALPAGTPNTQAAVEAAMLVIAQSKVDSGFTVTIAPGSSYNTVTKAWNGKFTVTEVGESADTMTDSEYRLFAVSML